MRPIVASLSSHGALYLQFDNGRMCYGFVLSLEFSLNFIALQNVSEDESSDVLARWADRWAESRLGWHKAEPHHFLLKYGSELNIIHFTDTNTCIAGETENECDGDRKQARILFPLCGKVRDDNV